MLAGAAPRWSKLTWTELALHHRCLTSLAAEGALDRMGGAVVVQATRMRVRVTVWVRVRVRVIFQTTLTIVTPWLEHLCLLRACS